MGGGLAQQKIVPGRPTTVAQQTAHAAATLNHNGWRPRQETIPNHVRRESQVGLACASRRRGGRGGLDLLYTVLSTADCTALYSSMSGRQSIRHQNRRKTPSTAMARPLSPPRLGACPRPHQLSSTEREHLLPQSGTARADGTPHSRSIGTGRSGIQKGVSSYQEVGRVTSLSPAPLFPRLSLSPLERHPGNNNICIGDTCANMPIGIAPRCTEGCARRRSATLSAVAAPRVHTHTVPIPISVPLIRPRPMLRSLLTRRDICCRGGVPAEWKGVRKCRERKKRFPGLSSPLLSVRASPNHITTPQSPLTWPASPPPPLANTSHPRPHHLFSSSSPSPLLLFSSLPHKPIGECILQIYLFLDYCIHCIHHGCCISPSAPGCKFRLVIWLISAPKRLFRPSLSLCPRPPATTARPPNEYLLVLDSLRSTN